MNKKSFHHPFLLILLAVDLIWLRSSWGKLTNPKFISTMETTLKKFASNNPYPWMKNFLQSVAIPNSSLLGTLVMWGEFLTAVALLFGAGYFLLTKQESKLVKLLLVSGLVGGLFLNLNFYFASGWMSPSTESLNLLMGLIELVALVGILSR